MRQCSAPSALWPLPPRVLRCSGTGSSPGWKSTAVLPCTGRDSGFLLIFLLPLLLLACGLLIGSLKVVNASQQRVAMQSRLDICALKLVKKREKLARSLIAGNQVIRTTAIALYMARGLRLLGGPAGQLLGALGEVALLRMNQAAARWQDLSLLRFQAEELAALRCAPTPYSRKPAFCWLNPALSSATKREPALMPDIAGPRVFLRPLLGRADCKGRGARTVMRLEGDASLTRANFSDRYEK